VLWATDELSSYAAKERVKKRLALAPTMLFGPCSYGASITIAKHQVCQTAPDIAKALKPDNNIGDSFKKLNILSKKRILSLGLYYTYHGNFNRRLKKLNRKA